MDILNSEILNIGGRLYINYSEEQSLELRDGPKPNFDSTESQPNANGSEISEWCEGLVKCPNVLFKYVIGYKGETKRRIEDETQSRIQLPRKGHNGDIIITAKTTENVERAKTRIQLLLSEKRWKEPFNYFVSIPLMEKSIKERFRDFKKAVLTKFGTDRGLKENLFQNEDKIHLTIGTLFLLDDLECQKAIEVLKRATRSNPVSKFKGAKIHVRGVEYMNDDPQMVDVLYAKVTCSENENFLQDLANYINEEFVTAGLMKKEHDRVKLHATVMNTIRTMEKSTSSRKGSKAVPKRETFDARNVLKMFKNCDFGEFVLNEIHISKRHSTDKNGYYESLFVADI